MLNKTIVEENFGKLKESISTCTKNNVDVIAVTKRHPSEIFSLCNQLGISHIGENRVQEFRDKFTVAAEQLSQCKVHFIGALQKNKIKYIYDKIDSFDALASLSQIQAFENKFEVDKNKKVEVLLQINSTSEQQKSGLDIKQESEILSLAERCLQSPALTLAGLMTMGPTPKENYTSGDKQYDSDTELAFKKCRLLFEKLQQEFGKAEHCKRLSMGMSHDFKIAISQGASEIRVGSLLFGQRPE